MEVDLEETPVTTKKKAEKSDSPTEGTSTKHDVKKDKKPEGEDPKPRIVLTFRSEKAGAKTSTMKIVPTEEKHEEVSPRRSSRRAARWDSDEEGELSITKKENDETSDSSHTALKRSTRRRSKEFDNVIANAIARKEKSYNETPTPTRPSRRIKPTAKVLANEELRIGFESQNNARLGVQTDKSPEEGIRTRPSVRGRNTVQEETSLQKVEKDTNVEDEVEEVDGDSQNQVMKLKHLCELGLKAIKLEDSKDEEDLSGEEAIELDDDTADEEIDDDSEVISKLLEADAESISDSDDEFLCSRSKTKRSTRSTRQHSELQWLKDASGRSSPAHGDEDHSAPLRRSSRKRRAVSPTLAEVIGYEVHNKKLRSTVTPEGDGEEIGEPAGGSDGSEAACPGDEAAVVASCHCTASSNVYAAPSELTEPVFCGAVETVDGVRVGCSHGARRGGGAGGRDGWGALLRAGPRAPYFLACRLHAAQLAEHMCCPACGLFCSQGYFYQCSLGHLFHLECGLPYNAGKSPPGCPHCGMRPYRWLPHNTNCFKVKVDMKTDNKRIFLPKQREQCTPAYLSFATLKPSLFDQGPVIPEDLLPPDPIDLKRLCERPDVEEDPTDAAEALCDAILAGEGVETLIPNIISGAGLNIPLPSMNGGTVLHAAAKRGHLSAVHLLHTAGADLNCVGNCKTPLMVAILALLEKSDTKSPKKNKTTIDIVKEESDGESVKEVADDKESEGEDAVRSEGGKHSDEQLMKVIRYLIAAGADVNIPGPDGMTALHMAAQYGGTEVCSVLLGNADATVDARDHGGWSALVWAAENQHTDTVRLLLANGANASAADNEGNSVTHWCALAGATRSLQLLLCAAPDAVNASNAHTDTPLHVAARQGHYACVIMLLARGARTDIQNSAGELPVGVCDPQGACHAAISLNMQMTLALHDRATHRLLSSDISRGRESIPVPCVNEIDDEPLPVGFTYVTAHVTPDNVAVDTSLQSLQGCKCVDDCSDDSCACCTLGVKRWWSRGRLLPSFPYHDPPMLFQCNQTCRCHAKKCTNSVIARLCGAGSVFVRCAVFRAGGPRGWGLRAAGAVPRGAPVAAYVGELLAAARADTRADDQYMFALDLKPHLQEQLTDKTQLCVDAASYGGAARFINHSCRPNLAPVRVFTNTRDLRLPTVTLFAARDIAPGEELTFDYGDKFWSVKSKWMRCECAAPDCRYPAKTEDADA